MMKEKNRPGLKETYTEPQLRENAEKLRDRNFELPDQLNVASYSAEKIRMDFQLGENPWVSKIQDEHLCSQMYIVFGSPGSGKDTVRAHVLNEACVEGFLKDTTRPMRTNEADGVSYNFHPTELENDPELLADARRKGLLSYKYTNHYYWFDAEALYKKLKEGAKIVLVVGGGTPQEAEVMKEHFPDITTLFVSPPEEGGLKPIDVILDRYVNRCKIDGTLESQPGVVKERKRIVRENYNVGVRVADHVIWNPSEPDESLRGKEGAEQIMGLIGKDHPEIRV